MSKCPALYGNLLSMMTLCFNLLSIKDLVSFFCASCLQNTHSFL